MEAWATNPLPVPLAVITRWRWGPQRQHLEEMAHGLALPDEAEAPCSQPSRRTGSRPSMKMFRVGRWTPWLVGVSGGQVIVGPILSVSTAVSTAA